MDTDSQKQLIWHKEILSAQTQKALDFLSKQQWVKESGWYMAGGTALALQTGIRKSLDLDFFTRERAFDTKLIIAQLLHENRWRVDVEDKNTLYGNLFGAKVSFIAYPLFIPKLEPALYGNIRVLRPGDIAVMKILAISQRGTKRDFYDLFWCAHNIEPLEKIITKLPAQYPSVAHNYHHILKSLVYFDDAEHDPEPDIKFDANWRNIKNFFTGEVPIIFENLVR